MAPPLERSPAPVAEPPLKRQRPDSPGPCNEVSLKPMGFH